MVNPISRYSRQHDNASTQHGRLLVLERVRAHGDALRRGAGALFALCLFSVVLPVLPVSAQSQNEIVTTVLYDGAKGFGDPDGSVDPAVLANPDDAQVHGPGQDAGPNNLVVRTHDQFAIRVDWNINEDDATNVVLTTVLPAFAEWTVGDIDGTFSYSGCEVTLFDGAAATASGRTGTQTVSCELGDQQQGSNGAIRMTAWMSEEFDNTTFDVTSTLTTDDDTAGVADGLDQYLTVSEAPFVDYIKNTPTTSPLMNNGTEDGYVLLYPLSFHDYSQGTEITGVGPILDSVDVEFFDHMWGLTPSVRLADATEMAAAGFAGDPCGDYAAGNAGAYVVGNGSWTCGAETVGAGGYDVVPITISGFTSRPFPATLADGTANATSAPQISAGQIALWISQGELDVLIADPGNGNSTLAAELFNSIVAFDGTTAIVDPEVDVLEAPGHGTSGPTNRGATANNTAPAAFGELPTSSSPGPGPLTGHDIRWHPGPLQLMEDEGSSEDYTYVGFDGLTTGSLLGIGSNGSQQHFDTTTAVSQVGQVARGQVLTLEAGWFANGVSAPDTTFLAPQQCIAVDISHYQLTDLPSAITVRQHDSPHLPNGFNRPDSYVPPANGFTSVAPSNGLAHVETGQILNTRRAVPGGDNEWYAYAAGGTSQDWNYVVEVSNSAPVGGAGIVAGITEDGLTCNPLDAGSLGWVDASGDLSAFDTDGDGLYEGITRVRIRSLEATDAYQTQDAIANSTAGFGWFVYLQARVLQDLDVNTDGQELFAFTSHSFIENEGWDGTAPLAANLHCRPVNSGNWNAADPDGSGSVAYSGWCSNEFIDDGDDSFDVDPLQVNDAIAYDFDTVGLSYGDEVTNVSGTLVSIVGAKPAISKTNNDGTTDIKDNGDLVTFTIRPSVTGAAVEALTNVVVTDVLPAHYEYVSHTQPSTPGSSCVESGGTITCQYSEPDPAVDTGPLPAGLAGGWPASATGDASFEVTVMVTGAIASPDSATYLSNTATVSSDGLGPWDPATETFGLDSEGNPALAAANQSKSNSAGSFMPLPADEGAIVKAVDTLEGGCVLHPSVDPAPVGWSDACSMIDHDGDMSFILSLTNEGNTAFSNIEIIDVFPHNADSAEPASGTGAPIDPQGSPSTLGDGRTPSSDFVGSLGFVSMDPVANAAGLVTYVTGDDPLTVSRDPLESFTDPLTANTWCDAVGGVAVTGSGACPVAATDVTATYSFIPGDLNPQDTLELRLTLDSEDVECDDIWTNTFGARVDQILLPVRSNDVSIMVNCEFDLALEKTLDPAFTPGADYLTAGVTTVDFLVEVTNQGDPVEDFDVTDYVDVDVFTFSAGNNPAGTTTGDQLLPFTWDATDPAAPVATVRGRLENGESVFIPVTLVVEDLAGPLENWAEISRFDSDGDPSNGDSDPANTNNPSTGALVDEDSIADGDDANDNQPTAAGAAGDGVVDGDPAFDGAGAATDTDPVTGDEDDHDVAGVPLYDLELVKVLSSFDMAAGTVTFDITVSNQGNQDVFLVDVVEYPPAGLAINTGLTTAGLPAGVTAAGSVFTIYGPIAPASAVTFPVTFDITDITQAPFTNTAEISAFDDDADDSNALSPFTSDVDSTPDAVNDDDLIDHTEPGYDPDDDGDLNEATPGDEDDHDIAVFTPPVRIGNFVWIDADNDGVQDAGELPVEGVVVNLLDANGDPVLDANGVAITTTTDAAGEYYFDVEPGEYIVEFDLDTLPADYTVTSQDAGADNAVDSDADPVTGQTAVIDVSDYSTLADSDGDGILDDYTWDMGIVPPVQIGNFVWIDADNDGIQDVGESPVAGVVVNLLDANGDPVLDVNGDAITTTTNAAGFYQFTVVPGEYIVEFDTTTLPANTLLTSQDAGSDDAVDSDADQITGQTGIIDVTDPSLLTDTDGDGVVDDFSWDAGIVELARIGNFVWLDLDNDGVQDAGESPVEGVVVNLLDGNGDPVLDVNGVAITTTTDAAGEYYFDVPFGEYIIEFDIDTLPADTQFTLQGQGDDATGSDADPATGLTAAFSVDPAALTDTDGDGIVDDYTHDAGIYPPVRIGNYVFIDENNDGVQDAGDTPVEGVIVNLLGAAGDAVLDVNGDPITTVTDAAGEYYFDVPAGMYIVEFDLDTLPADYTVITPGAGSDGAVDSDADQTTGQTGVIDVSDVSALTDTDGDGIKDDYSWDMGIVPNIQIGNFVFIDENNDGVQDPGDTPVEGAIVNLLDANGDPVLDTNGDPITTTTDANGEYSFTVEPGLYMVEFDLDTLPVGFMPTSQNTGSDSETDSDANSVTGLTSVIDVSDPSQFTDTDGDGIVDDFSWDMGIVQTAQIGNFVFIDENGDGIQDPGDTPVEGVVVNLLDANGDPVLDGNGQPITTTTDVNGEYVFEVPAGDYIIEFDPTTVPAGLQFIDPNTGTDAGLDSDVDPTTGHTSVITVDPDTLTDTDGDGIVDDYTWDAGLTTGVEIGNYVWFDTDGDGIQDPEEAGVAGVIVELLDANGDPVLDENGDPITATTDADGAYLFTVTPGDYQLQFTPPEGYVTTTGNAGGDDATDSDANPFGFVDTFTVVPGVNDYTLDVGLVETQLISGVVWDDENKDGIQDPNETVRSGVLVELFDANGDPVLDVNGDPITAVTDVTGYYEFPVPPGDYRLKFTAPNGTSLTPGSGSDHDADVDGLTGIISVLAGVNVPDIDAGLVTPTAAVPSTPLAFTGSTITGTILTGLTLLLMGMYLVTATRRRKETETA